MSEQVVKAAMAAPDLVVVPDGVVFTVGFHIVVMDQAEAPAATGPEATFQEQD
jgi:hypothetical protein